MRAFSTMEVQINSTVSGDGWMDTEIGGGCHDSLMAHDSGNYWNTLGAENEAKEDSSLSPQIWVC